MKNSLETIYRIERFLKEKIVTFEDRVEKLIIDREKALIIKITN